MADLIGTILADRFRVLRMLGKGGMGQVYEVELVDLPKRLAIKVLTPELARKNEALLRFRREAELIAKLNHPNLVEILDWYSLPDGMHFYVMEVLKGQDLSERIKEQGPLSIPDLASLAKQCFSGLLEAHRQGAVHRDLKPANVFLAERTTGFHVKIIDFGLARARDMASITVYNTPMLIGTPAYMSPEQIKGVGPADQSADTWAMAALLYEAASGEPPFKGTYPLLLTLIGKQRPIPVRVHRPDLPAAFADAIAAALTPNETIRLRSAAELAEKIALALDGSAVPSTIRKIEVEAEAEPLALGSSTEAQTKNERISHRQAVSAGNADTPRNLRRFLLGSVVLLGIGLIVWTATNGDNSSKVEQEPGPAEANITAAEPAAAPAPPEPVPMPPEEPGETQPVQLSLPDSEAVAQSMVVSTIETFNGTDLDLRFIRERISKYLPQLRACQQAAIKNSSTAYGEVRFRLRASQTGRVTLADIRGFDSEMDSCIKKRARSWRFRVPVRQGKPTSEEAEFMITFRTPARIAQVKADKEEVRKERSAREAAVRVKNVKKPLAQTPSTAAERRKKLLALHDSTARAIDKLQKSHGRAAAAALREQFNSISRSSLLREADRTRQDARSMQLQKIKMRAIRRGRMN